MVTGKPHRLAELAAYLGGELAGDGNLPITGIASLQSAGVGDISFVVQKRMLSVVERCKASAVIVPPALAGRTPLAHVICKDPYLAYARIAQLFNPASAPEAGVHPTAVVESGATIAVDAAIGAGAFVGRGAAIGARSLVGPGTQVGAHCSIGTDCLLHARVTLYPNCSVGDRTIIHSGCVIGADGFGFAPDKGTWLKIPQTGRVVIGDDVEIGANTTVDRGALDDTVIENGVKLDNQIQVAHNVRIGAHTAIAAMTGIAGSASIGSHCMIGGAVRIMGHVTIADRVQIAATSFVSKSIAEAGSYSGALPFAESGAWLKNAAWLRHLDRLAKRVKNLERRLEEIAKRD